MSDTSSPHPASDQALKSLWKLAEGNDVALDGITLIGADERIYTLTGMMKLEPSVEKEIKFYPGPPIGKGIQKLPNAAALRAEVEQSTERLRQRADWVPAALQQLKEQDGYGWGQGDAKIFPLGDHTVLATSEACPSCRGQKMIPCSTCHAQGIIPCPACHGSRYEVCYGCNGHGVIPGTNQPCTVCSQSGGMSVNGLRAIPCRTCQGRGQTTCPTCQGRRGTPCPNCKATGLITEEVNLTLIVRTHFTMLTEGAPSGLRRGLDRLGAINLVKGHADIEMVPPPKPADDVSEEEAALPGPESYDPNADKAHVAANTASKAPPPEVHYAAHLPYADMRMDFGGKKALVSVFGKKGILLGVPPFLDAALEPARTKLSAAARGEGQADDLSAVRIFRDAFALSVDGKDNARELKRLYPIGLSPATAEEIVKNMRAALGHLTRRARIVIALLCVVLSWSFFAALFLTSAHRMITQTPIGEFMDLFLPVAPLILSSTALSIITALRIRREFSSARVKLWQKTGIVGYSMGGAILFGFFVALFMSSEPPAWLNLLRVTLKI